MPIPKEILDVDRPTNTVVIAYGKNKDHTRFDNASAAGMLTDDIFRLTAERLVTL